MQDECEKVGVSLQDILDVNVVAACGPPGGGRNPISPRLLKNFWSVVHAGSDSVWFSYKHICAMRQKFQGVHISGMGIVSH